MFETFSFLPPLSAGRNRQASAILVEQRLDPVHRVRGRRRTPTPTVTVTGLVWTPPSTPTTTTTDTGSCGSCRCTVANDPAEVLAEVKACVKAFPNCYVRVRRLRQHQASAMPLLLGVQTEVGPDGGWCQRCRRQTNLNLLSHLGEKRFIGSLSSQVFFSEMCTRIVY